MIEPWAWIEMALASLLDIERTSTTSTLAPPTTVSEPLATLTLLSLTFCAPWVTYTSPTPLV